MSRMFKQFYQYLQHLSPERIEILHGVGLAFDPCPVRHYETFLRSDEEAMWSDWNAIGHDMKHVMAREAQNERIRSSR